MVLDENDENYLIFLRMYKHLYLELAHDPQVFGFYNDLCCATVSIFDFIFQFSVTWFIILDLVDLNIFHSMEYTLLAQSQRQKMFVIYVTYDLHIAICNEMIF